ncbi:MAG TPA: VOC family protein [Solirubrobacteraceae bacterium]|nr:VOC family protein [Solirubrobacteraceae bacterium]
MRLEGLHHVTMITGDARRNVEFYAEVLGLRMVKKTVNFDDPRAYHLYFGDEAATPGSILTWFEYAGVHPGEAGAGMIHTLQLGVASEEALDFWADRLRGKDHAITREAGSLRLVDPDGLALELLLADEGNAPLRALHPEIAPEHAILGVEGARAYALSHALDVDSPEGPLTGAPKGLLTETLGFTDLGAGEYRLEGGARRFRWAYDRARSEGRSGAGTVHHIAWASRDEDHVMWQRRVREAGGFVTEVKDRDYFRSIYFREPHGILFEIATLLPGFAVDEDPERLGEALRLPKMHEHLRERLERELTPVVNPRTARRERASG